MRRKAFLVISMSVLAVSLIVPALHADDDDNAPASVTVSFQSDGYRLPDQRSGESVQ